jgi:hypothetical protein
MAAGLQSTIEDNSGKFETTRDTHVSWSKKPTPENMEKIPVEMKSVAVNEEFLTEVAAVKSSGTMKKGHRGWHIAAGRRGEPKELTQMNYGSARSTARLRAIKDKTLWRCRPTPQKEEKPISLFK